MKRLISLLLSFLLLIFSCPLAFADRNITTEINKKSVAIHIQNEDKNKPVILQISSDKGRVFIDQQMTDEKGNVSFYAYLDDYNTYTIDVNGTTKEITLKELLDKTIQSVLDSEITAITKDIIKGKSFTFREKLGLSLIEMDGMNQRINKNSVESDKRLECTDYAGMIIAKTACKESASVEIKVFENSLTKDGYFKIGTSYTKLNQVIWSMIALEYAKVQYDASPSLKIVLNAIDNEGKINDIDTSSMALMAIAPYIEDSENAKTGALKIKTYLKKELKTILSDKNTCTLATVIQGLASIGEDPLSKEWQIENNNLFNALIASKENNEFPEGMAREQAFLALIDLETASSMYSGIKHSNEQLNMPFISYKTMETSGNGESGSSDNNNGNNSNNNNTNKETPATLTIKGPSGTLISNHKFALDDDRNLMTAITELLKAEGISYTLTHGDKYIAKIDGVGEFYDGAKSGWMYRINGKIPTVGLASKSLKPGMVIELFYTKDYTQESHSKKSESNAVIIKKPNDVKPIKTKYGKEFAVLNNYDVDEKEVTNALDNVRDKVLGQSLKAKSSDDAIIVVDSALDAVNLMQWSIDNIKSPDAAEETLKLATDLSETIAKSAKLLEKNPKDDSVQKVVEATQITVDNALSTMCICTTDNNLDNIESYVNKISKDINAIKESLPVKEQRRLEYLLAETAQEFVDERCIVNAQTREGGSLVVFDENNLKALATTLSSSQALSKKFVETAEITGSNDKSPTITLNVDTENDNVVGAYISKEALDSINLSAESHILVKTPLGIIELPDEIKNSSNSQQQIKVSLERIAREDLPENIKTFIKNDSQVIDLTIKVNRLEKSVFKKPIQVSIPYDAGESIANKLVVYHEKDDGSLEKIAGVYNVETKMLTFKTTHFSKFFVKPVDSVYDDIDTERWSAKAIQSLSATGVVTGREAHYFMPEEKVTRAEFATMLSRLMTVVPNNSTSTNKKGTFSDVDNNQWYAKSIETVYERDWMSGKSDGRFDPNGYITQQEIACVMAKLLSTEGYQYNDILLDDSNSQVAKWAQPSVALVEQLGLTDNLSTNGFVANKKATREEVTVLLNNLATQLITQ